MALAMEFSAWPFPFVQPMVSRSWGLDRMGTLAGNNGEYWRGGAASLRFVAGLPFRFARMAHRGRDRDQARLMLERHCARFLDTCRVSVSVEGAVPEPGQGCVVCHNETSFIDVAAYFVAIWPHVDRVAGAEFYGHVPFSGPAFRKIGVEMVARGNRTRTDLLLARMVTAVRQGERVGWSGEGRLSGQDGIGPFKVGASLIAIRAQAPVIPVVIHGGHGAMPLGTFRARSRTVRIRFSDPMPTAGYTEADARAFADRLRQEIVRTYDDMSRQAPRKMPMPPLSAVSVIAARFNRPLTRGEDISARPTGATLSAAGTEISWDSADGYPRRERTVRIWMAIWPDLDAAEVHLADRGDRIPILAEATETIALLGVPFACHGNLNWSADGEVATLYPHLGQRPVQPQPILVMTSLGIGDPGEGLLEFGQGVQAVREGFAKNPSVLLDINMLPDLPMIDGPTLTLWSSEQEIINGAYRSDPHKTAMKLRNGATARGSFTRMAVVLAEGVWNGTDLGDARADAK
jgi:1-acyl-sn-glycerol-3-phosphate acyltransferase